MIRRFKHHVLAVTLAVGGISAAQAGLDFSFSPLAGPSTGTRLTITGSGTYTGNGAIGDGQGVAFDFGSTFASALQEFTVTSTFNADANFTKVVIGAIDGELSFDLDSVVNKDKTFAVNDIIDFASINYASAFTGPVSLVASNGANFGPGNVTLNVLGGGPPGVPEPSSFLLGGLALVFGTTRRRRKV